MISNIFTLVVATASLANAVPLLNFAGAASAGQAKLVRRAANNGQLAQGSNFYFQSLHIEDECTPGQVACVSGSYATCSGEANWELQPCAEGTTCFATPASSASGLSVQCTTQDAASSAISYAGGDPNQVAADYHIVTAPFEAETVPTATESPVPTATETPTPTASEPAGATETCIEEEDDEPEPAETESADPNDAPSPTETCIPEDEDEPEPTPTESVPAPTDAPSPAETCTEEPEEPAETETLTLILFPVPSQSGVYSTSTLLPQATDAPSNSESASPSPTESSSVNETPAPTEVASYSYEYPAAEPTESSSESISEPASSEAPSPAATETSITIPIPSDGSAPSIPPVNTGAQPTPAVVVVGVHFIPGGSVPAPTSSGVVQVKRRMQKKIRRV